MTATPDLFAADPLADPAAVLVRGQARFTVLTPRIIRCEWHEDGRFEDRATLAVSNRRLAVPAFTCRERGGELRIATGELEVRWRDDGRPFSRASLAASFRIGARRGTWRPAARDAANLGGTVRTLDRCDGGMQGVQRRVEGVPIIDGFTPIDLGPGLLSRAGLAVHDDSASIALTPGVEGAPAWVAERHPGRRQDLYLLASGRDYAGTLAQAARIFGRQPLPPRWAFGFWYSKYWAYTDRELEGIVADHDRLGIPLDVLVMDMDWHQLGWTGYTWAREYFPDHRETLAGLRERGVRITLNLHPADGVAPEEERYAEVCRDLGRDPARRETIPFDCTDPRYMAAYFRHLHHPHEDAGVDFWWLDWQQGSETAMAGLDPLPWLNHLHWHDPLRRHPDRRPLILSRYGGLGSGRYPLGFSGDTLSTWASLRWQPHFTATAANVLYGYWSHDIGGHNPGPVEPELYLRWLQYGALSPVLRCHTNKTAQAERRIGEYPSPWRSHMIAAVERRYELVPYIASECRAGVESGLSLCRPMYHAWPERDEAYRCRDQYLFGGSLIAAPVLRPAAAHDGQASVRAWLPEAGWIDSARGEAAAAGWRTARYLAEEVPLFVRAGAVLPGQCGARRLVPGSIPHLLLAAWAGGDGAYLLREDDGESLGYARGEEAAIPLAQHEDRHRRELVVGPAAGGYRGFAPERLLSLRVHLAAPPEEVRLDGRALPWSFRPRPGHWSWDGDTATVLATGLGIDLRRAATVSIRHRRDVAAGELDGLPGRLRRLRLAAELSMQASLWRVVDAEERLCADLAQAGNRMSRDPSTAAAELARLRRELPRLRPQLRRHMAGLRRPEWRGHSGKIALLTRASALVRGL